MRTLPYGTWPSPLSPDALAGGQVTLDEVRVDGPHTYWLEGRPADGGRQVLVRHDGTRTRDVLPAPWHVRSRVHEYGGGAYAVSGGTVVFSEVSTGVVHRLGPQDEEPVPLTVAGPWRFGGLVLHGDHVWAVREDHSRVPEPANELVRIDLSGSRPDGGTVVFAGADFVSRPAVAPDGAEVAWVVWDHPDMPWDSTRLLRARVTDEGLDAPVAVAGGDGTSVVQPHYGPDGALWFVSDETGWWLVHRDADDGPVRLHDGAADHAQPQWSLGIVDLAVLDADRALVHWWEDDGQRLGVLDARTGRVSHVEAEGTLVEHLGYAAGEIVLLRGRPDRLPEVVRGGVEGPLHVLAESTSHPLDPAWVSPPRPLTWHDTSGLRVHGLLHEPRNPEATAPEGTRPPLVVMAHGGPTSRTQATFSSTVQFWTTRGFAVLLVDYSGSSGYGRAYRDRLRGRWGELDIDDCVSGARTLAETGAVDGERMVIRGGSAGGYTVLRAMTTSSAFAAGTSLFGISDLTTLMADTHKFESQYPQRLVAPWPEGSETYRERSPVHHVTELHGQLLLLQGAEDRAVPLAQAEAMAAAMVASGRSVELQVYEGEGHGFRRRETLVDALERELAFYTRVLALTPDPP